MSESTPSDYLTSLFSLEGRTALITGGVRGIGASIAIALAKAGANIILLSRDVQSDNTLKIKSLIESIRGPENCHVLDADLLNDTHSDLVQKIRSCMASYSPDILVNCAGVNRRESAEFFDRKDWDDVLQVNLTAAFTMCQVFGRYWIEKEGEGGVGGGGGGSARNLKIINVSSILSQLGSRNVVSYVASKGGMQQMTRGLSNEWMKHGINVNALAPGYTATEFTKALQDSPERNQYVIDRTPAGRWGKSSDLDGAAVYLASQASNFVSGETLTVDGGFTWYC